MSEAESLCAVLVKDSHGYKEEIKDELTPVVVHQGSLLAYLDSLVINRIKEKYDCIVNYRLADACYDSEVFFFATDSSVLYITSRQRDLLLGIEGLERRVQVLDKLEWAESLTVGCEVCVTIDDTADPVKGIIRYIGELPGEEGRNFGVELLGNIGQKMYNGCIKNQKLFECDNECTVYVAMDKLSICETIQASTITNSIEPNEPNPLVHKSALNNCTSLTVSDDVVFSDKFENLVRGTVISIGPSIVEVQLGSDVCLAHIPSVRQPHFLSDKFNSVLLPIASVRRDLFRNSNAHNNLLGSVYLQGEKDKSFNPRHSDIGSTVQFVYTNDDGRHREAVVSATGIQLVDANPHNLKVGSVVKYGDPPQHGVIRWIGNLRDETEVFAGVEMYEGGESVTHDRTCNGKRHYDHQLNKGTILPLSHLEPYIKVKRLSADDVVLEFADRNNTTKDHTIFQPGLNPALTSSISSTLQLPDQNQHKLDMGSKVQYGSPAEYGVVKWIGMLHENGWLYAGIETENTTDNCTDGMFEGVCYFESHPGRGKFVKVYELQPDKRCTTDDIVVMPSFEVGSRVRFGDPEEYGKVTWIGCPTEGIEDCARVLADDGKRHGLIPLSVLQLDTRCTDNPVEITELHFQDETKAQHTSAELEVGSMIQFGNPVKYGVIRRIEAANGTTKRLAEVETEDGKHKKIPLHEIQLDNRFCVDVNDIEGRLNPLEKEHYKHDEKAPCVLSDKTFDEHKHTNTKGIQGYKNSCYLDATLYGMFMFSDAFNDLLLQGEITANPEDLCLQTMLKCDIVYPLRKKGIVIQEAVEGFREHLARLQKMKDLTSEEKDPEEFLNLLFKHVLYLDPFVIIRRPSGIDREFFIQIFVEPDEGTPTVNTQKLLIKMFQEQNISFIKHPTRLLLQMPRYGKRYKTFKHIIPSLELDVTSLCHTTGPCSVCNQPEGHVCVDCSFHLKQLQLYCVKCLRQHCDHQHECHDFHNTGTLQLLSVLCIETSHYVCFTRITGSGKDEWVFFDSMAERQDNGYNLPKVTCCTNQLKKYVYGKKNIGKTSSKELPELARRFVQDAYLCIYIDHNGVM